MSETDTLAQIAFGVGDIAKALERLAAVAERVYPPPPDRATVQPAGEQALTRPRLKELAQWEHDDRMNLTDLTDPSPRSRR